MCQMHVYELIKDRDRWKNNAAEFAIKSREITNDLIKERNLWRGIADDLYHGRCGAYDRLSKGLESYEKAIGDSI